MKQKKGGILNQVIIQIILVALIFGLFLFATAEKVNARGVKQQILEKQTALLIDSATPGMIIELPTLYPTGDYIEQVTVNKGRIHITVNGLLSPQGYPFFTPYHVTVEQKENKFLVLINE